MKTIQNMMMPMRDGTKLAANVYQPDTEGARPAILLRTPYIKERITIERLYSNLEELTGNGYNVVVQDVRGTGCSEGVLLSCGGNEVDDGYDTVEWIAAQPWCDGHVGMFGLSYFGFDQMAAAEQNPPHLDTVCPFQNSAIHPLSITRANTFGYYHLRWIYGRVRDGLPNVKLSDEQMEEALKQIAHYEETWDEMVRYLPTREMPAARIEGLPILLDFVDLVDGVEDPEYWKLAHRPIKLSGIDMPMFFLTGWFDGAKDGTFDNYLEVMNNGTEAARKNSRLIVGPWTHGGNLDSITDGTDFGEENSGVNQKIQQKMINWFDRWLKGKTDVPSDPPVYVYQMGSGRWLSETEWPPKRAGDSAWYLSTGKLTQEQPAGTEPETYAYNPDDPFPSNLRDSEGRTLLADPSYLDSREDVLVYYSEELKENIEVAGDVRVRLYASTDVTDTDFFAKLCDVDETGRAFPLLNGVVRARFRNGLTPDPLTPGQVYEFEIDLGHICLMLKPGHKIRLSITSSCFPEHDRNLNTGERTGWGKTMLTAHQTIYHDQQHPSQLILPVLKG